MYQQYFRDEWLELPEFTGWLRKDTTNLRKAICSFCQKSLNAKHSALIDHSKSEKHIKNAEENVATDNGGKKNEIRTLLQIEDDGTIPPDVQAEEEITDTI